MPRHSRNEKAWRKRQRKKMRHRYRKSGQPTPPRVRIERDLGWIPEALIDPRECGHSLEVGERCPDCEATRVEG